MSSPLSQIEFEALVKRAGLPLSPAEIADMYSAWPHIERFAARLRNPARGREAEPAHLFRPLNAQGV
ncbi:MAG: hypothetical protein IT555_06870 [Acetobacteraceae bacterium]|nr:hypothetical protein [Acetobacteraceae bacterium]